MKHKSLIGMLILHVKLKWCEMKRQKITKMITIHSDWAMNLSCKLHNNSSNSCKEIFPQTINVIKTLQDEKSENLQSR